MHWLNLMTLPLLGKDFPSPAAYITPSIRGKVKGEIPYFFAGSAFPLVYLHCPAIIILNNSEINI